MRLLYVFVICVFASVNVLAADLLPLDKDGFGGIKWGTEFSSADKLGMKECIDIGSAIICEKKDESLKEIGGVPVEVKYKFDGAYLNHIYITFDDELLWPKIIKELSKAYGESDDDSTYRYSKSLYGGEIGIYGWALRDTQILEIASDIDTKEASINRFDKMALSIFTGAERKSLDGFLGAKWGMAVEQLPQKVSLASGNEETKIYKQVENYFGSIPVHGIFYCFADDKLILIYITSKLTFSDIFQVPSELFRDILELNFGKFHQDDDSYNLLLPKTAFKIQFAIDHDAVVIMVLPRTEQNR